MIYCLKKSKQSKKTAVTLLLLTVKKFIMEDEVDLMCHIVNSKRLDQQQKEFIINQLNQKNLDNLTPLLKWLLYKNCNIVLSKKEVEAFQEDKRFIKKVLQFKKLSLHEQKDTLKCLSKSRIFWKKLKEAKDKTLKWDKKK